MKPRQSDKLAQAVAALEHALEFEQQAGEDRFYFAGIAKCFEICLEYAWKEFRRAAVAEGLEVYSPREAIKTAGRLGLVDNVEQWLGFLEDRNTAVHDYLGISDADYLETIKAFLAEVRRLPRSS